MYSKIWTSLILLMSLLGAAAIAPAQYFGRNKVQYEDFDFEILRTEHFDIYYYAEEERAARVAARMAERWYERLSRILDHELTGVQPLILYAAHPHFQQTNVISGLPPEGTRGVTESLKRRIVMPLSGPLRETDHVLGHELVHAFQYDLTSQNRSSTASSLRFPLWFTEGMAEYLSIGPVDTMTASWIRQAAIEDELPGLNDLSDPRYFPYRFGHAFWAYVGGRFGDAIVGEILKRAADTGGAIGAIKSVLQKDPETISEDWKRSIRETYEDLLEDSRTASDFGRALLTDETGGGSLNVAPSISPDGRQVVFLSERDLFAIEMFLADAETGKVERKIVETATDPHFESLQFIRSSGSWSPDGGRFIFAALHEGQPVLSILDISSAEIVRERRFPRLGEIFNASWSPDGKSVVFAAIRGGLVDLYLLDLETDRLERLTEDAFAEIHPVWSPAGDRILFVTDRFASNLKELAIGRYQLATINVDTGRIRRVPLFSGSDHWDPQWVDDEIYFLSDADGRPELYRYDVDEKEIFRVTALSTGAHGITKLSPAITVSSNGERLLFTARENEEYRIYSIAERKILAGRRVRERHWEGPSWAALPPARRPTPSRIAAWFDRPERGLPETDDFPEDDYEADLNLDYVGQPYLVGGADRFGSFVGGGISFLWSDMLGNHNLGTQAQISGGLQDIAAIVGYENRDSRWTWGGSVSQIPFRSGRFASAIAEVDGELAQVEQLVEVRQTERRVSATFGYPFNRVQRLEFSTGFVNYTFSQEADVFGVSLETGRVVLDENGVELDAPSSLNLGQSSAALVYDASVLGPTSPLLGSRYRFEVGGNYGSLDFADVLADYRHYFMPKQPFTIALRGMHFGRYGSDAEDSRLTDQFLGFPNLVRGYQSGSFTADECRADGGCPVFERLLGSRIAVANVEFRFPLMAAFGLEPWSSPIPVELAFFGDAGVAWSSDITPSIFGGDREAVSSAGLAIRAAVQRFLTLEFDFVRPFDRPQKGWMFEFNIKPGF